MLVSFWCHVCVLLSSWALLGILGALSGALVGLCGSFGAIHVGAILLILETTLDLFWSNFGVILRSRLNVVSLEVPGLDF
jgi:hypothetical protein